jgi:3-methyladenine DNA glycosylase AlkD
LLNSFLNNLKKNKDFFIQKAIGWSLSEESKTFTNEILFIIEDLYLIGLAYKESMKYLVKIK